MRLFQSAGFGAPYLATFNSACGVSKIRTYAERKRLLLADRYDATHILKPVYDLGSEAFFTVGDDRILQGLWAAENGLRSRNLADILLAQIEDYKPDVLYQLDPILFPSAFLRRLPGSVKKVVAWRAASIGGADLSAYDVVLSNFSSLNIRMGDAGLRTAFFSPSWDPEMAQYSNNIERDIDVFFTGTYSRATGHGERLELLNAVGKMGGGYNIDLRLMAQKWGRLTDRPFLRWIPVPLRLPKSLKKDNLRPVYGRAMYFQLSQSKIVLNPATTIAGNIRGNMRCWEALGCGACMLGSDGIYPEGFECGVNFEIFNSTDDLLKKIQNLLMDDAHRTRLAKNGSEMLSRVWSKERQWRDFEAIVASL